MEELVTIKQEPQWMINDDVEYATNEMFIKEEPAFTEYEIRPYYENDIDFQDIKYKVGFLLFFLSISLCFSIITLWIFYYGGV